MKQTRLKPEIRKEDILAAALPLAERAGYLQVRRNDIAAEAGVSGPAVQYHFGTMAQLRRDLMRYAVKHENLRVIAQGITADDPQVKRADAALRRRALDAYLA